MTQFVIDFKGATDQHAQEISSAVGMRGLYIGDDIRGEFDFPKSRFDQMLRDGSLRPASYVAKRIAQALQKMEG